MLRAKIFSQLIRYLALCSANYRVPFVFTCVQLYSSSVLVFHSCSLQFTRVLFVFYSCSPVFRFVWSFRSDPLQRRSLRLPSLVPRRSDCFSCAKYYCVYDARCRARPEHEREPRATSRVVHATVFRARKAIRAPGDEAGTFVYYGSGRGGSRHFRM